MTATEFITGNKGKGTSISIGMPLTVVGGYGATKLIYDEPEFTDYSTMIGGLLFFDLILYYYAAGGH